MNLQKYYTPLTPMATDHQTLRVTRVRLMSLYQEVNCLASPGWRGGGGVKDIPTVPTISSTLASYTVFSDAKINGILYPGNELNGVDDAHEKIDASDHQKPHKFFLASLIFLLLADHEWSREYER